MNDSSTTSETTSAHAVSDEQLACRVQEGCSDSFDELAKRLQPRLLFVLRRRMQNDTDVEDVVQKTLLRAYEKIHQFDTNRKFSPWLFTIALRLAADHHRQQKPQTDPTGETAAAVVDPTPSPEQLAINAEESNDLWSLAEQILKPEQWTALWLLFGEGQTIKEIAHTLGRTNVSVRVMLYRARKTLTPHLAKYSPAVDNRGEDFAAEAVPQIARAES